VRYALGDIDTHPGGALESLGAVSPAETLASPADMLNRVHGVLFVLLGLLSAGDGWRITQQARVGANFDAIGPDRYLITLGALMLIAGVWRLLSKPETEPRAHAEARSSELPTLALTLVLFAAFAFAVPYLGFSLACFLFLTAELWVLSRWAWWKTLALAVPIALAFHVAFITFADMPLPKGYFGI
jgi:hypothetical protein